MDPAEPRLVLGTAGHIDHGKTALIRALTGVDTDRLPEEKARGITIELGFAPLDLGDGLVLSVVDVPGHEGLVRTMVAGATGIDFVLLVVAADEGVMPQTREHTAICDLLGIRRGVVALSKMDLVDETVAELAAEEVEELLAGTSLEGAPILRVSPSDGEGLDALRAALAATARQADARTPRAGPPRLFVDRHFAMKGFGTVVTGTLVGAALSTGDAVEIHPGGLRARVRGLQHHGAAAPRVEPGSRCAVNLQGVELSDLSRGQLIATPGALEPTRTADARIGWLEVAPPCRERTAVELLVGTAERRARLAPIGAASIEPGGVGFARLHVDGPPLPLLPGDRFIVRGFARTAMGGSTLGGGVILDVAPPRRRRSDPALLRDLEVLAGGDLESALEVRLRRAGLAGCSWQALRRESGLDPEVLDAGLNGLERGGRAVAAGGETWMEAAAIDGIERRLVAALDAHHAAEPMLPGMNAGALRGALPGNVPPVACECALERLTRRGDIVIEGELVRRPSHRARLSPADRELAERVMAEARGAGLDPPSLRDWAERLGARPDRVQDLLAFLEREGRLVRAPGDLWFDAEAVAALRERVIAHLERHGRLDTPDYKALIGTTRRTAVPLMELFDEQRLTARRGEARLLRSRPA